MHLRPLTLSALAVLLLMPMSREAGAASACNTSDPKALDQAKACGADVSALQVGTLCRIEPEKVRPTQMSVGRLVVACSAGTLKKELKANKLDKALREKVVPAIVGPAIQPDGSAQGSALYITDRHHFSSGVLQARQGAGKEGEKKDWRLYVCVEENLLAQTPNLSADGFVAAMQKSDKPRLWPNDLHGEPIKDPKAHLFAARPSLTALEDDPYRTLADWAEIAHGWIKCAADPAENKKSTKVYCGARPRASVFYAEFIWADYLRRGVTLPSPWPTDTELQAAALWNLLPATLHRAVHGDAEKLPGYNPGEVRVREVALDGKGENRYCVKEVK